MTIRVQVDRLQDYSCRRDTPGRRVDTLQEIQCRRVDTLQEIHCGRCSAIEPDWTCAGILRCKIVN